MSAVPERFDSALILLARALKGAGIARADTDPTKLTAPCAWVTPRSFDPFTLDGTMSMTTDVVIVAPDWRQSAALTQLAADLERALTVIDDIEGNIEAATISLPSSGQANLPALIITTSLEVKGQ